MRAEAFIEKYGSKMTADEIHEWVLYATQDEEQAQAAFTKRRREEIDLAVAKARGRSS